MLKKPFRKKILFWCEEGAQWVIMLFFILFWVFLLNLLNFHKLLRYKTSWSSLTNRKKNSYSSERHPNIAKPIFMVIKRYIVVGLFFVIPTVLTKETMKKKKWEFYHRGFSKIPWWLLLDVFGSETAAKNLLRCHLYWQGMSEVSTWLDLSY